MDFGEGDVVIRMEAMELDLCSNQSAKTLNLLRGFIGIQERRAKAYARWHRGFAEYMAQGGDLAYQQLCVELTAEFNECSKQVLEMESLFLMPDISRCDLACLLKDVQAEEKQKLHLTARIQILKKAGRPSERLASQEHCQHEMAETDGTDEAEADAEYDRSLKEAIRGVQEAVTRINELFEEVRYEVEALQSN